MSEENENKTTIDRYADFFSSKAGWKSSLVSDQNNDDATGVAVATGKIQGEKKVDDEENNNNN